MGRPDRHSRHDQRREKRRDENAEPAEGMRIEAAFPPGARRVVIDQTAGKLTVRPCAEGEAPGAVTSGAKSPPRLEVRLDGPTLHVSVKMLKGWLFRRGQGATTVVRLERAGLDEVKVDMGYGDILVQELSAGGFAIDVGAGQIRTQALEGSLRAGVGAGKIAIESHAGLVRADTGTGDLLIDVARTIPGDYEGGTGIGRVEIRLPAGEQVSTKISSGIGKARNEYPDGGEQAPIRVRLAAGVGEAVVKVRPEPKDAEATPGVQPLAAARARPAAARTSRWSEAEQLRVLQLLEQGKITAQEAADLIAALQGSSPPPGEDAEPEA